MMMRTRTSSPEEGEEQEVGGRAETNALEARAANLMANHLRRAEGADVGGEGAVDLNGGREDEAGDACRVREESGHL